MTNSLENSTVLHLMRSKGLSLFYKKGYYNTTISALAEELSISEDVFKATFPSKKDFFISIIQNQLLQHTLKLLIEPNSYKENPFPKILRMLENDISAVEYEEGDHGLILAKFLSEFNGKDKEITKILLDILKIWEVNLTSVLKKGQLDGYVDDFVDTESAANYIISSYIGIRTVMIEQNNERLSSPYIDQLRYYFNSISKKQVA